MRLISGLPNPETYHPSNHQQVYEEHASYRLGRKIFLAHAIIDAPLQPKVSFDPGVKERVGEWLEQGKGLVFVSNHQRLFDHMVDITAVRAVPELKPIAKRGYPLAKAEYFDLPSNASRKQRATSYAYRALGAIPAYRQEYVGEVLENDGITDVRSKRDLVKATNDDMANLGVSILARGDIVHGYPETTRNQENWARLLDKKGSIFARILHEANSQGIEAGLLIAARSYGVLDPTKRKHTDYLKPHIRFGAFLTAPVINKGQTTAKMFEFMAKSLQIAHYEKGIKVAEQKAAIENELVEQQVTIDNKQILC